MAGARLHADQKGTLVAKVKSGDACRLYTTDGKEVPFPGDGQCSDIAFLPSSFGLGFVAAEEDGFSLYTGDETMKFTKTEITTVGDGAQYTSSLNVSVFEQTIVMGFISDGVVHIYELAIEGCRARAIHIRRFADDHMLWLGFAGAGRIYCVSADALFRYSMARNRVVEKRALTAGFVDAAVSPTVDERIAILGTDGSVDMHNGSVVCKVGDRTFSGGYAVSWNPFGCTIAVTTDNGVHVIQEVLADSWQVAE